MPVNPASNRCHADNRMTTPRAYRITNGKLDACPTCTRIAWVLVAIDLDSRLDEMEEAS